MNTSKEVREGKTPNGGVLTELYFFSEDMKPVEKKDARIIIIREVDKDGDLVFETQLNK